MRCTRGCRTTSFLEKNVNAMPSTPSRISVGILADPTLPRWQVDLRHVAGNHGARPETDSGQEHLHLFHARILGLVENHERLVQRAAAHECQRRDFYDVALDEPGHPIGAEHVVERVVHRPQIRVDFLRHIAGQEAETFTRLDGGPHQHDAPNCTRSRARRRRRRSRDRSSRCRPDRSRTPGRNSAICSSCRPSGWHREA